MTHHEIEHWKNVLRAHLEWLPRGIAKAEDRQKDAKGVHAHMVANTYRSIGIAEFIVNRNTTGFRENLSKSAELSLSLFRRFDAGEPIDPSYLAMLAFKHIFDALAAGNFSVAHDLAAIIGGRPAIERKNSYPLNDRLGYALKETILGGDGSARQQLQQLLEDEDDEDDDNEPIQLADFRGYGIALDAIASHHMEKLNDGLRAISHGHYAQAFNGICKDMIDAPLCVWGIGIANLARHRKLSVNIQSDLLPAALII